MTIVAAKHSFIAAQGVRVAAGDLYPADHPVPQRYASLFGAPDMAAEAPAAAPVEAATATPGEARTTKRQPRQKRSTSKESG